MGVPDSRLAFGARSAETPSRAFPFRVEPLSVPLGAEIFGVDISTELDDAPNLGPRLSILEVCYTAGDSNFPEQPKPKRIRALQKFERVRTEAG